MESGRPQPCYHGAPDRPCDDTMGFEYEWMSLTRRQFCCTPIRFPDRGDAYVGQSHPTGGGHGVIAAPESHAWAQTTRWARIAQRCLHAHGVALLRSDASGKLAESRGVDPLRRMRRTRRTMIKNRLETTWLLRGKCSTRPSEAEHKKSLLIVFSFDAARKRTGLRAPVRLRCCQQTNGNTQRATDRAADTLPELKITY
ncbi:hypothetical protein AWB74_08439 [Caballeronia arvi]|uniref:Uncharacterized protein n=1 Tax=Caballeronia arvi TaxID=1777135 RepID=A0A158L454_9BURK|nr:hypothetical protein AWB74_08439 [Caballeronia arvi]